MSRCCAEASILMQAAERKFEYPISRKCFGMAEEVESRQTPVDAVQAQVFG